MRLIPIIWPILALILISKHPLCSQSIDLGAALVLERSVMLSENKAAKTPFLWQKYDLFKQAGGYQEALQTLNRMEIEEHDSIQLCKYYYQKALVQTLLGQYSAAMTNVNDYCAVCARLDEDQSSLRLLVLLENEDWNGFNQVIALDTVQFVAKVTLQNPEQKDARTYVRSASILPGLGLVRLGYVGKGLSSFGLCVGALGFAAYNIYTGFYATSLLSGIYPFQKFYKGGKRLTEAMVDRVNIKKASSVKQAGYQYIQKRYF